MDSIHCLINTTMEYFHQHTNRSFWVGLKPTKGIPEAIGRSGANFFSKGPDIESFGLCGLYRSPSPLLSSAIVTVKPPQRTCNQKAWPCSNKSWLPKAGRGSHSLPTPRVILAHQPSGDPLLWELFFHCFLLPMENRIKIKSPVVINPES